MAETGRMGTISPGRGHQAPSSEESTHSPDLIVPRHEQIRSDFRDETRAFPFLHSKLPRGEPSCGREENNRGGGTSRFQEPFPRHRCRGRGSPVVLDEGRGSLT